MNFEINPGSGREFKFDSDGVPHDQWMDILTNFVLALLAIEVTIPLIDLETMMPVLMGMLGLGAMRSYEKTKGVSREK